MEQVAFRKTRKDTIINFLCSLTRSCITCGSICGTIVIAFLIACIISEGTGSASTIMSSGRTYRQRMGKLAMLFRIPRKKDITNTQEANHKQMVIINIERNSHDTCLWYTSHARTDCQQSTTSSL